MKNFLKEFKDFIATGSMIELAVAFILGVAVAAAIKSFIDDIVMQIVAAIVGQPDFRDLTINLRKGAVIRYGAFINAALALIITGLVLFLLIKAYNRMKKAKPDEVAPTEVEVLQEIRDLLRTRA
jgi:large conductance mechanosensitive channel